MASRRPSCLIDHPRPTEFGAKVQRTASGSAASVLFCAAVIISLFGKKVRDCTGAIAPIDGYRASGRQSPRRFRCEIAFSVYASTCALLKGRVVRMEKNPHFCARSIKGTARGEGKGSIAGDEYLTTWNRRAKRNGRGAMGRDLFLRPPLRGGTSVMGRRVFRSFLVSRTRTRAGIVGPKMEREAMGVATRCTRKSSRKTGCELKDHAHFSTCCGHRRGFLDCLYSFVPFAYQTTIRHWSFGLRHVGSCSLRGR